MAVYVDDMRAKFGRMIMCHMFADTDEELHVMAEKIGMRRAWFQGDHYDVSLTRRASAVENGAQQVPMRWAAAFMMNKRRKSAGK